MKLNLSEFKKVSDNATHAMLEHPKGHRLAVAKSSLTPKMRAQLAEMPMHMDEGGLVPEGEDQNPAVASDVEGAREIASDIPLPNPSAQAPSAAPLPQESQPIAEAAPSNPVIPQAPKAAGSQIPLPPNMVGQIKGAYNRLGQAMEGPAEVAGAVGQAKYETLQNINDLMAQHNTMAKEQLALDYKDWENTVNEMKEGKINPNAYLENLSTPGKVMTAIGLILGGIGGGLTHQENPALKFINAQIDRDIEAQKARLGRLPTLLSAMNAKYHNRLMAEAYTRSALNGYYANMLDQVDAQAMGPQAQANKEVLKRQLDLKALQEVMPYIQQQAMLSMINKNPNIPPEMTVRFLVPEGHQKEAFDEISRAKETELLRKDYAENFNHVKSLLNNGLWSPYDRESAINVLAGKMEVLANKRFNFDSAKQLADSIFPSRLESDETSRNKMMRAQQVFDSFRNESVGPGFFVPKVPKYHIPQTMPLKGKLPNYPKK